MLSHYFSLSCFDLCLPSSPITPRDFFNARRPGPFFFSSDRSPSGHREAIVPRILSWTVLPLPPSHSSCFILVVFNFVLLQSGFPAAPLLLRSLSCSCSRLKQIRQHPVSLFQVCFMRIWRLGRSFLSYHPSVLPLPLAFALFINACPATCLLTPARVFVVLLSHAISDRPQSRPFPPVDPFSPVLFLELLWFSRLHLFSCASDGVPSLLLDSYRIMPVLVHFPLCGRVQPFAGRTSPFLGFDPRIFPAFSSHLPPLALVIPSLFPFFLTSSTSSPLFPHSCSVPVMRVSNPVTPHFFFNCLFPPRSTW